MIKELAKLTRFEHAIMFALAVFIAETIVLGKVPPLEYYIILSLLVPILSEMGSFALNDYFDIETDRINRKTDRPIVSGSITPEFALYFSMISLILSSILAYAINLNVFAIAIAFNIVAVLYNWKLKDMPLLGNIYIAMTMSIPFLFGNLVVSTEISEAILPLVLLGFVAGIAREVIKSVQDMEGDKIARSSKTIPIILGEGHATTLAIILYLMFIPLTYLPFLFGLELSALSAVLIIAADFLIALICIKIITRKDYSFARDVSLIAFFMGLLGVLVASV